MGNGWFSSNDQICFNAPHRIAVGWVPANKVIKATTEGRYLISPLNLLPSNTQHPQVLTIVHPDNGQTYYFSYLSIRSNYSLQTLVHLLPNKTSPTMLLKVLNQNGKYFVDARQR